MSGLKKSDSPFRRELNAAKTAISIKPFYIIDAVLLVVAIIIFCTAKPFNGAACWGVVILTLAGACISAYPWMRRVQLETELEGLAGIQLLKEEIGKLTACLQDVKQFQTDLKKAQTAVQTTGESVEKVGQLVHGITEDFQARVSKAAEYDREGLKNQIEQAKQGERSSLAAMMGLMDHILGFTGAGMQSENAEVVQQMRMFRNNCTLVTEAIGLRGYIPQRGEPFDLAKHKLAPDMPNPGFGSHVDRVLAPGYYYRDNLVRFPIVTIEQELKTEVDDLENLTPLKEPETASDDSEVEDLSAAINSPAPEEAISSSEDASEDLFRQETFESILAETASEQPEENDVEKEHSLTDPFIPKEDAPL